jgi:DNA-binding response OmpR family regulator
MATALIVEDHPDQASLVARILRLRDFESIIAEDGKTALRLARQYLADVLLLDLMLPDVNGFDEPDHRNPPQTSGLQPQWLGGFLP